MLVHPEREKLRAVKLQQMWETFFNRQLPFFLAGTRLSEYQELSSVTECIYSKCLNDTSRALILKMETATLLVMADLASNWSYLTSHMKYCDQHPVFAVQ